MSRIVINWKKPISNNTGNNISTIPWLIVGKNHWKENKNVEKEKYKLLKREP